MKITEDELFEKYNIMIDKILDECDWKTHFIAEEVCGIVCNILTKNNETIVITPQILYEKYIKKVKELHISNKLWRENFHQPEIISMIYEILESIEGPENLDSPLL